MCMFEVPLVHTGLREIYAKLSLYCYYILFSQLELILVLFKEDDIPPGANKRKPLETSEF